MRALLLISILLTSFKVSGQFIPCIDSGRINPMFQCNDQFYNPVCGCNGITYRNQCAAYNMHGVTEWRSGVCSGIDLDFYPNPVGPASTLTLNLSFPEFINGNVDVKIVDVYGKTWEQRMINNFNRTSIQFDVSTLKTGVYIIIVTANNGASVVRQLCKY